MDLKEINNKEKQVKKILDEMEKYATQQRNLYKLGKVVIVVQMVLLTIALVSLTLKFVGSTMTILDLSNSLVQSGIMVGLALVFYTGVRRDSIYEQAVESMQILLDNTDLEYLRDKLFEEVVVEESLGKISHNSLVNCAVLSTGIVNTDEYPMHTLDSSLIRKLYVRYWKLRPDYCGRLAYLLDRSINDSSYVDYFKQKDYVLFVEGSKEYLDNENTHLSLEDSWMRKVSI